MPYFVIAGKPDCKHFIQVQYMANYLRQTLPDFKVQVMQKYTPDWENWLDDVNKANKWQHYKSPIVWKELSMCGGKAYLIGGISEFWEYCDDYYGLNSLLSEEELDNLLQENVEALKIEQDKKFEDFARAKNICITGAMNPIIINLLPEIIKVNTLSNVNIFLHDLSPDFYSSDWMSEIIDDITNICNTVTLVDMLDKVIEYCELLIVLDDMSSKPHEEINKYIARNISYMVQLSDVINHFAKRHLRVILADNGPICLNATVLIECCTSIRPSNVVAVTSDLGLRPLSMIARQANLDLIDLSGPPVWGFIGLTKYIDVGKIIKRCQVYRPYERATASTLTSSSLPLGTIRTELRFINYLTDDISEDLWTETNMSLESINRDVRSTSNFAKVRALISLLNLWYADEPSDEIISLGVNSNGSYGIPRGMVFSQPAMLVDGVWKPFPDFPVSDPVREIISSMAASIKVLLEEFGLGPKTRTSDIYNMYRRIAMHSKV